MPRKRRAPEAAAPGEFFPEAGLAEACWLGAALTVPLWMNTYAQEPFQPNKIALLRIFALLSLPSLLWRSVSAKKRPETQSFGAGWAPFAWCVALLAAAYLLATFFSINPSDSLWGSYNYLEGTFTFFCEVILFFSLVVHLRSRKQLERLVTFILVASLPVSLYGVLQRFGVDPLHGADSSGRVFSTIGHPVYLAHYLGMVFPLTIWRGVIWFRAWRFSASPGFLPTAIGIFYFLLGLAQWSAFVSTESRGGMLGLLIGVSFFGLLAALAEKRWTLLQAEVVVGGLVALLFFYLNESAATTGAAAAPAGLQRYAETLPMESDPDEFRAELWKQALPTLFAAQPVPFPLGGEDRFHALRPWIGYGPETLACVLPETFAVQPNWEHIEDRFHDVTWDVGYSLGIFGLAGFFGVILFLLRRLYVALRLVGSTPSHLIFAVILALGALAGIALLAGKFGAGFAGAGLVVGLVGGLCAYALGAAWRPGVDLDRKPFSESGMLLMALAAALIVHLINLAFAFSVATTDLLFWFYAALAVALTRREESAEIFPELENSRPPRAPTGWEPVLVSAGTTTLILVALLYGFIHLYSYNELSAGKVLWETLTQIQGEAGPSHLIFSVMLPTWLGVNFILLADAAGGGARFSFLPALLRALALSLAGAVLYAVGEAALVTWIGPLPRMFSPPSAVLAQAAGYHALLFVFLVILGAFTWLGAAIFSPPFPESARPDALHRTLFAGALIAMLAVGGLTTVSALRAAMTLEWSEALLSTNRVQLGVVAGRRAVKEAPGSALYRRLLADALVREATTGSSDEAPEALLEETEQNLLQAQRLTAGMDLSNYQLARLYVLWAFTIAPADQKTHLLRQAKENFDRASIYQPGCEPILKSRAQLAALMAPPAGKGAPPP